MSQINKVEEGTAKRMNLNVPTKLHYSFKSATAAQGQNMTDVVLDFIKSYVAKHATKSKGRRK